MANTKELQMKAKDGKMIVFSRPYLNENKELAFLDCSEAQRFPNIQFILNEKKEAIELRKPQSKKQVFLLLKDDNKELLKDAQTIKKEIMKELVQYTNRLTKDEEPIWVWETNVEEYPYFFTTPTIIDLSYRSSKFVAGLLYFLNEKAKKAGKSCSFEDYNDMQRKLGEAFSVAPKEDVKIESMQGEKTYIVTMKELLDLFM